MSAVYTVIVYLILVYCPAMPCLVLLANIDLLFRSPRLRVVVLNSLTLS